MANLNNPHRHIGLPELWDGDPVMPSVNVQAVTDLLARCPDAAVTPMIDASKIAEDMGIARLSLKDETARMGIYGQGRRRNLLKKIDR